jgi:hypothetical protein
MVQHADIDHTGIVGTGGSGTHSFLGTTSAGGSTESSVAHQWYMKQFTAPGNGILLSIDTYWTTNANGATPGWMSGVWADSAGAPSGRPLFHNYSGAAGDDTASGGGVTATPGYTALACGLYVPNGTVLWGGVLAEATSITLYYAAGGSDRVTDQASTYAIGIGFTTLTNSTKNYSIRFSFLEF